MLELMEYQWRSLKGDVVADGEEKAEARQLARMKMGSMGIGAVYEYYRTGPDQPWTASGSDPMEDPLFDSDFPRS